LELKMNTNTPNTTKSPASDVTYFDLHTTGIGYLSRVRKVKVKKDDPYTACTIGALRGSSDEASYTFFDCNVVGDMAISVIEQCNDAVNAKKKVLLGFTIGDVRVETFVYGPGDKEGKTGVSLKGRLFKVAWVDIDGQRVYNAPKAENIETKAAQTDVPAGATILLTVDADPAVSKAAATAEAKLIRAAQVAAAKATAAKAIALAEALEAEEFEEEAA
jgi:Protein of unknown function (DUF3577)